MLSRRRIARRVAVGVALVTLAALPLLAQRGRRRGGDEYDGGFMPNHPYDGQFTMARIKYGRDIWGDPPGPSQWVMWSHDYPNGEIHFSKLLDALTLVHPYTEHSNIYTFDDPELMKFPIAYFCEVGSWRPTDKEAEGMRNYLLKGGFLIIDDFGDRFSDQKGREWYNFVTQLDRVLPGIHPIPLEISNPIFDSFFKIPTLDIIPMTYRGHPEYYGLFEDNDPKKRMMAVLNYDNDISEYWEFPDFGPIDLTNDAYKLGVNDVIYALTH